ncbi:hypothetical protein STAFG_1434 [Streptomyces afghaniensis 772]|uniref:GAF domain-containing protein n=1 Tax=Streptomyces afghaniensis 772 TaxID=1283301 RepID=S4N2N7_9ACTN|nr:hypothetical protein STAFG_1434 [Streptomyces afghaniensis 772]
MEGDRLTIIGHHGQQQGDDSPFSDMALDTDYPAAEVVRTGRAVYLSSPEQYKARYPLTWPLAQRFGRRSWAFLPLTVAGRTMGAWMAAFTYPVAFTPDERSVLATVARMLAQALARAGVAESERALTDGLQRTMLPRPRPAAHPGHERRRTLRPHRRRPPGRWRLVRRDSRCPADGSRWSSATCRGMTCGRRA